MTFKTFSNEELTFIHVLLNDMTDVYNKVIEDKGVYHLVNSPVGQLSILQELTPEALEALKLSDKVRLFNSITTKLAPIVELIEEADPEMVQKIVDALSLNPDKNATKEEDL